ncbi:phosphatase PAP2 family protein [Phytohabitans kaempferiae]|uniref:Phosphatase PAP2 family protein n=1 Tax=Phytohabitans kaempferiae TaxID=1620943 RepID=A0ABV6LV96_9ACTN
MRELVIEVILIASMMVIYQGIRHLADGQLGVAFRHADWVWAVERALHLPSEAAIQDWALSWGPTARLANIYYVGVHFPGTIAAMVWLWIRHRPDYLRMRTEMAVLTGAALAVHVVFPLAPPRLVPSFGMVDTMILTGPSAYPDNSTDGVANQFAAMPSLHVGWALLVAIALIRVTSGRWRWLALAHPILTVTVVVITANHYWLDGIVAGLLLVGAIRLVSFRTRYVGRLQGQPLPSFSRVLL